MNPKASKWLRIFTAIPLGLTAIFMLIFVPNAHVTMCMAAAVGYACGLPVNKYEEKFARFASFFSGGILFYTVYAGTSLLFVDWFTGYNIPEGGVLLDAAWWYHFLITFSILVLFWTKKDRMTYLIGGMSFFMLAAPLMLLFERLFGRELFGSVNNVLLYTSLGLFILVTSQSLARTTPIFYQKLLAGLRKFIIVSLVLYATAQIAVIPFIPKHENPKEHKEEQGSPFVEQNIHDIYPQVWTKNGFDGESYEYKVNCGSNYATLNECFLFDLTAVEAVSPNGETYQLDKDFNINEYSGEITRRWVLYGPAEGGLPGAGDYTFNYLKNNETVYSETFNYQPQLVAAPSNIMGEQVGNGLEVSWSAPEGINEDMWYKVIIFRPDQDVLSEVIEWDKTSALLDNLPINAGDEISFNVSVFFSGGYAYPPDIDLTWQ